MTTKSQTWLARRAAVANRRAATLAAMQRLKQFTREQITVATGHTRNDITADITHFQLLGEIYYVRTKGIERYFVKGSAPKIAPVKKQRDMRTPLEKKYAEFRATVKLELPEILFAGETRRDLEDVTS